MLLELQPREPELEVVFVPLRAFSQLVESELGEVADDTEAVLQRYQVPRLPIIPLLTKTTSLNL